MPVGELLARTSSRELTEWAAFEREYGPLGPERGDWHAAQVAHVIAAVNAGKKGRRLKLSEFVLRWGTGRKKRQTPQDHLDLFRAIAARQTGEARDPR